LEDRASNGGPQMVCATRVMRSVRDNSSAYPA